VAARASFRPAPAAAAAESGGNAGAAAQRGAISA